jgi:S-adenosylmethionine-diacylglycerol 3-amino-3-carboxypropyl transferase
LDHEELLAFFGLAPSENRMKFFQKLASDLTPEALAYWTVKSDQVRRGVVYTGRYESFIGRFIRFLAVVQGKNRIENFFRCATLDDQRAYFDRVWNTLQWRLLFKLAFNKRTLAKRGLTTDYFKFDDGSSSFAESFFRRSRHAMCEIPIATNYFLAQYLRGSYLSRDAVPDYLRRENLAIVRDRLDRIEVVTCDAQGWFAKQADSSIDAFSLSNICELMSPDEAGRLFAEVARTGRTSARICFRNLIVPRGVPEHLSSKIELQEELSRVLLANDRSFVYSRVHAYVVR